MKTSNILQKLSILVLFMLTALGSHVYAQSHNVKCASCKYWQRPADAKNVVNTGCVCEACRAKDEKERKAKQAEDKRRNDILVAKQNAEAAERERQKREAERKEIERIAYENAEKKRRDEATARLKQESEAAQRRASEIQSRYKQLANVKGSVTVEEIEGLEAYNDKEYFGVKFNGDFLWRKPTDNLPISIRKISGTNYFIAYNGSKGKLYDMYGTPLLIDGEEWFDNVFFDKEKNIIQYEILEEDFYKASDKTFSGFSHEVRFYTSKEELLAVHNQLYQLYEQKEKREQEERERAAKNTYEDPNKPYRNVILVYTPPKYTLYIAKGKSVTTDLKLKILEKKVGYFIR